MILRARERWITQINNPWRHENHCRGCGCPGSPLRASKTGFLLYITLNAELPGEDSVPHLEACKSIQYVFHSKERNAITAVPSLGSSRTALHRHICIYHHHSTNICHSRHPCRTGRHLCLHLCKFRLNSQIRPQSPH